MEEIASELGVSPRLLTKWRALPGFQEALEGACMEQIMADMPQLLRALTEKAKEGNVQAIKILFDYLGQIQNRSAKNLGDLDEEERQRYKEALLREIASEEGPAQRDGGMG
jgi:dihydrodipicolinate synthase/N-acetylneuraminate lyase